MAREIMRATRKHAYSRPDETDVLAQSTLMTTRLTSHNVHDGKPHQRGQHQAGNDGRMGQYQCHSLGFADMHMATSIARC